MMIVVAKYGRDGEAMCAEVLRRARGGGIDEAGVLLMDVNPEAEGDEPKRRRRVPAVATHTRTEAASPELLRLQPPPKVMTLRLGQTTPAGTAATAMRRLLVGI